MININKNVFIKIMFSFFFHYFPGVLVIKKNLLCERSQSIYDSVGIIGAVRAGLVVQLKETIGTQCIASRHEKLCK